MDGYDGPQAAAARDYFAINFGPWDRLAGDGAVPRRPPPPRGAGYYPEDLTREEFDAYLAAHPEQNDALTST